MHLWKPNKLYIQDGIRPKSHESSLVSAPVLRFAVGSTTGNVMPEPLEVWHQKKKATLVFYLRKYLATDCKCELSVNMNSGYASTWVKIYLYKQAVAYVLACFISHSIVLSMFV